MESPYLRHGRNVLDVIREKTLAATTEPADRQRIEEELAFLREELERRLDRKASVRG
jgi:flagellin-like hook-associated protein FlgL